MSAAVLADQLANQTELQRKLVTLAHAQADALRRGDVDALRTITAEQEAGLLEAAVLERERARRAFGLAQSLGLAPEASIADLVDASAAHERDALAHTAAELRGVVAELIELNRRNRALVEQELATIDHLVRNVILGQGAGDDETRGLAAAQARLLDREA